MKLSMVWLVSALVPAALAQPAPKLNPKTAEISGRVTDARTGQAVRDARIILRDLENHEAPGTVTGPDGQFLLKDVQPGRYRLWADRSGFVRGEYGARAANRPGTILSVAAGGSLPDINIRLTPVGAIGGRVVSEHGEPLQGVEIYCLQRGHSGARPQLTVMAGESTDDLGEFRVHGLAPGRYLLAALYRPERRRVPERDSSAGETYVTTYYPGTSEPGEAQPVEVGPGAEVRGVEFSPVRRPAVLVSGRARALSNYRCTKPNVMLAPADSAGLLSTTAVAVNDAEGNFEISGVAMGPYTVFAQCNDGTRRYSAMARVDVGPGGMRDVDLLLGPGVDIAGRVRFDGRRAADLARVRIHLDPRESPLNVADARVNADGAFTVRGVGSDVYTVLVTGLPDEFYIKAITSDGSDVMKGGLSVSQTAAAQQLEVVLGQGSAVEGSVLDDQQNLCWGAVVLIPAPERRGEPYGYRSTTTDNFGRFALRGIGPGQYTLLAWEDIEGVAYRDPAFLARFEQSGERVQLGENDKKMVQVRVIPAEP